MKPLFALLAAAVFLGSCDGSSNSTPVADTGYRTIPASAWKQCPVLPASRTIAVQDTFQTTTGHICTISFTIHDSTGRRVAKRDPMNYACSVSTDPNASTGFSWNGKDESGNAVPTGHYFVFLSAWMDGQAIVTDRVTCIGIRS